MHVRLGAQPPVESQRQPWLPTMHVVGAPEPAPGLSGVSNMTGASPLPVPFLWPPQLASRIASAATAPRKVLGMFPPSRRYQWRDSPSTCDSQRHVHRCATRDVYVAPTGVPLCGGLRARPWTGQQLVEPPYRFIAARPSAHASTTPWPVSQQPASVIACGGAGSARRISIGGSSLKRSKRTARTTTGSSIALSLSLSCARAGVPSPRSLDVVSPFFWGAAGTSYPHKA